MQSFWHFNEDHGASADILTSAILFSTPLTLWCPAGALIDKAFNEGRTHISKSGFLLLLEQGVIRIAGRKDWFYNGVNRQALSMHDPLLAWDEGFDPIVAALLDRDKGTVNPTVFEMGNERGLEIADNAIEKRDEHFYRAEQHVLRGNVPIGTTMRVQRIIIDLERRGTTLDENERRLIAVHMLIRNSVNHNDARISSGAQFNVEFDAEASITMDDVAGRKSEVDQDVAEYSADKVLAAIDFAHSLSGCENAEQILYVKSKDRQKNLINDLICCDVSLSRKLSAQIQYGTPEVSYLHDIFGKNGTEIAVTLVGQGIGLSSVLSALRQKHISRRNFTSGLLGFGLGSVVPSRNILESTSFVGESDYSGPIWPFVTRFGTNSPTLDQIGVLLSELESGPLKNR